MITYFDTSALVPLLVEEPGSATSLSLWRAATDVVCSQLGYVETAAALARATRLGRMTTGQQERTLAQLDQVWDEMTVLPVDESLARQAAALARAHALRGFDAVHCAAALRIADADTVAASGDGDLLAAWRTEGLPVADTGA